MGAHPEIRKQQMTSYDVVEKIIKPEAKGKAQRYADLLKDSFKRKGAIGTKELVSDGECIVGRKGAHLMVLIRPPLLLQGTHSFSWFMCGASLLPTW